MSDKLTKREVEAKAFTAFKHDLKAAIKAKVSIDKLISEWNDLYYGKSKKVTTNRSKIVMKEIAKQIEWQKPNITEPFLSTSHPIRVTSMVRKHVEKYLNNHFTSVFNRDDFINQLVDVVLREGTGWVRTGWRVSEKNQTETFDLTMQEIVDKDEEPISIEQIDKEQDLFRVTYRNTSLDENHGTARVCRNEYIFPDPGANTAEELRFLAERRYVTLSDLKKSGFYSEAKLKKLAEKIASNRPNRSESSLENQRNDDNEDYGQDDSYQPIDDPRKKIAIIEMWGHYDLDGDGIAEPVLATWAEKEDIDLDIIDNPLPKQNIPFYNTVYSARPFSLWGNALAYFIGDNQKVKTGIVRGILDNMSLANNGQKFIKRGTLNYINFKRMRNGERHIIVNKENGIEDGTFNSLPASVFNTLSMFTTETEQLSGVSSGGPALNNDSLAKDDTGSMQMTMAQQRMASLVRMLSNTLGKVCKDWITMAEVFLSNEQIDEMFTDEEETDYFLFKNSNQTTLSLKVGTDVGRMIKMQQLNMLLQQSKALGQSVPPDTFNKLVAEMYELFDMYDDANELREYQPEPSPEQMKQQQLSMQKLELENQKLLADINEQNSEVENKRLTIQMKFMEAQANIGYKGAQSREKDSKAESHRVNSSLEPAKVIAEVQSKQQQEKQPEENRRTI